jgi:hypothetical protein
MRLRNAKEMAEPRERDLPDLGYSPHKTGFLN